MRYGGANCSAGCAAAHPRCRVQATPSEDPTFRPERANGKHRESRTVPPKERSPPAHTSQHRREKTAECSMAGQCVL